MKSKLILCLALVLSGGLFGCCIARAYETNAPMKIKITGPWTNTIIKLIVPDSSSTNSKTEMIAAKEASYKITRIPGSWDGFYDQSVVAIHDPHTKKNCIIADCDFYLSDGSGMTGYAIVTFDLLWHSSVLEIPDSTANLNDTITQFETKLDGRKMFEEDIKVADVNRIRLREATSEAFWGYDGSQSDPKIDAIDVTYGIMRLDMTGSDYGIKASVWIDLKTKKAIRTVENGVEMNIHSGKPWAVPLHGSSRSPIIITNPPKTDPPTNLPADHFVDPTSGPAGSGGVVDPATGLPVAMPAKHN